jgi:TRAP-type C4-dicarboxylate transport system permease small subunit
MKKAMDNVSLLMTRVGGVVLWLVMLLMVINVITRTLLNAPIKGSIELVQYGMLIALSLGLSRTGFKDRHVYVSIVLDALPPKARAVLRFFGCFVSAGVFVYLTIYYITTIPAVNASGRVTEIFRIPYGWINLMMGISMLIATALFIYQAVLALAPFASSNNKESD